MENMSIATAMARQYITSAEEVWGLSKHKEKARELLLKALDIEKTATRMRAVRLERGVAIMSGEGDEINHRALIEVLTHAFALAFVMGEEILAETVFKRAYALSIDARYGDIEQGKRILSLWIHLKKRSRWQKVRNFFKGLFGLEGEPFYGGL